MHEIRVGLIHRYLYAPKLIWDLSNTSHTVRRPCLVTVLHSDLF